jgi:hypothetical protein
MTTGVYVIDCTAIRTDMSSSVMMEGNEMPDGSAIVSPRRAPSPLVSFIFTEDTRTAVFVASEPYFSMAALT